MGIFRFFGKKRASATGFQPKKEDDLGKLQAFILEPILTPSGLVDSPDDAFDPLALDVDSHPLPDIPHPVDVDSVDDTSHHDMVFDGVETHQRAGDSFADMAALDADGEQVSELDIVPVEYIYKHQTFGDPADVIADSSLEIASSVVSSDRTFDSGVFTVGDSGEVGIDFLFDGGGYHGELAIFSLDGMEQFEPGSDEFIQEAAHRALSNSQLGHVVIHDPTEGAKFHGVLPTESDFNAGEYQGAKTFTMRPGDTFGVMLVPHGTLGQVFDNPAAEGYGRPLFSMTTANPNDAFHVGQIADVTGGGNTFAIEDLRVDGWTDHDYNDIIFSVRGATGTAVHLDNVIDSAYDWRGTDVGQELLASVTPVGHASLENHSVDIPSPDAHPDITTEPVHTDIVVSPTVETDSDYPSESGQTDVVVPALAPSDTTSESGQTDVIVIPAVNEHPDLTSNPEPTEVVRVTTNAHSDITSEPVHTDIVVSPTVETDSDSPSESGHTDVIVTPAVETDSDITVQTEHTDVVVSPTVETHSAVTSPVAQKPISSDFSQSHQPLIGVIDTGFSANNPDIDYSRIILGQDRVDGDANPLLSAGEGNEHGTHVLSIIGATQDNDIGIDGANDEAPIWLGRATGSGQWSQSLIEFVDAAKESQQPNAVVNLSFDLTQVNPDGTVITRYELTPQERQALEYARANHVLIVAAAGNQGQVMSSLGQASQEFDNIITVGAADGMNRAAYSSYGSSLDILAVGGSAENPVLSAQGEGTGSFYGTSAAAAEVTGAVSQVWAANPELSYRQVIDILNSTATDLSAPGWDVMTGFGLLNLAAALEVAKTTVAEEVPSSSQSVEELPKAPPDSSNFPTPPSVNGTASSERPTESTSSYSSTSSSTGDSNAGSSHDHTVWSNNSNDSNSVDGSSYTSSSHSSGESENDWNWSPSQANYSGFSNSRSDSKSSSVSNSGTSTSRSNSSSDSSSSSNSSGSSSRVITEGDSQYSSNSNGSAHWDSSNSDAVSTSTSNRDDRWSSNSNSESSYSGNSSSGSSSGDDYWESRSNSQSNYNDGSTISSSNSESFSDSKSNSNSSSSNSVSTGSSNRDDYSESSYYSDSSYTGDNDTRSSNRDDYSVSNSHWDNNYSGNEYTNSYNGDDYSESRSNSQSNYNDGSTISSSNSESYSNSKSNSNSSYSNGVSTGSSNRDDYSSSSAHWDSNYTGDNYTSSSNRDDYSESNSHWDNNYSGDEYTNSYNGDSYSNSSSSQQTNYIDGSSSKSINYTENSSVSQSNSGSSGSSSSTVSDSYSSSYNESRWDGGYSWNLWTTGSHSESGYNGNEPWNRGNSWSLYRSGYYLDNGYFSWTETWNSDTWNNDIHSYESYSRSGESDPNSDEPDSNNNDESDSDNDEFDKSLDDNNDNDSGDKLSEQQRLALAEIIQQLLDFFRPAGEFVAGAVYQYLRNIGESARWLLQIFIPGWNGLEQDLEKSLPKTWAFGAGRAFGDGAAIVTGILELISGGGAAASGVSLCATGVGCIAGAPAVVAGVAVGLHGTATLSVAARSLAERLGVVFHSTTGEGSNPNPQPNFTPRPGVGGNGSASDLPDLRGVTPQEAQDLLYKGGFEAKNQSAGGWQRFKHPDKSEVNIHWPTGRVVRTPAPKYGTNGARINNGQRLKYDGTEIPLSLPHDQHPLELLDVGTNL